MGKKKRDGLVSIATNSPEIFDVESRWLYEDEKRLNASSYSAGLTKAKDLLDKLRKNGVNIENLNKFSKDIFVGAMTKRLYTNKNEGILTIGKNFIIHIENWKGGGNEAD